MTPKQKAEELVTRYRKCLPMNLTTVLDAKNCALIAIEEVLYYSKAHGFIGLTEEYEQIKLEIEKL